MIPLDKGPYLRYYLRYIDSSRSSVLCITRGSFRYARWRSTSSDQIKIIPRPDCVASPFYDFFTISLRFHRLDGLHEERAARIAGELCSGKMIICTCTDSVRRIFAICTEIPEKLLNYTCSVSKRVIGYLQTNGFKQRNLYGRLSRFARRVPNRGPKKFRSNAAIICLPVAPTFPPAINKRELSCF